MRILTLAALSLFLIPSAFAQPSGDPHHPQGAGAPPAATSAPAAPGMMGMMAMMQGMRCPMMGGHTEGVLAFLKAELKITAAQSSSWEAFAKAYREVGNSAGMMSGGTMGGGSMAPGAMPGGGMPGGMGGGMKALPDQLAMHTQMMERHLANTKKLQAAIQPLYRTFDASQKKSADELLPMIVMMAGM